MAFVKLRGSWATREGMKPSGEPLRFWFVAVAVALTLLVWLVFGQTLRYDFVNFDDDRYVYAEPHVARGLSWDGLTWMLTHSHASLWHPLTTLSHMVDCQIFGLRAGGHHFTNVLLHNIAAILLFLVLQAMTTSYVSADDPDLQKTSESARTGNIFRSAVVAALFAIHPMRVESVAWIAERKDILSAIFFMLTLTSYLRYVRNTTLGRYIVVSILVACGLMSKATFVTVPFVLLLLDYWPLRRGSNARAWRRLVIEKIPLMALAVASSVVTLFAQTVTLPSLEQLPLLPRIKNAVVSTVIYIVQIFWPVKLAVFYPHPHDQLATSVVLASAVFVVGISFIALRIRQKRPYIFVGWFWYLVMLFPVLGIIQAGLQGHADRFVYLPHIGISIALVWTIGDVTQSWRYREWILGPTTGIAILALAVCAAWQTTYWRDSISLWRHALAVTSNNQIAHQNLAAALWQIGRKDESRNHSRAAAIIHWETAVKDYPNDPNFRDELGVALIQNREPGAAIEQWETSLRIDPNNGNAQNNLAWVLATYPDDAVRNGATAVSLAEKAVNLPGGDNPMVLRTLAAAYAEDGDFSQAVGTATRAADLAAARQNPSLVETLRHEISLYRGDQPYRELPPQ